MSLISRLFGTPGLLCPRCERSLDGHDDAACARKMSRRWFIGATLGAAASAIVAPAAVCHGGYGAGKTRAMAEVLRSFIYAGKNGVVLINGGPVPGADWLSAYDRRIVNLERE